jgi:xylulose-5-phosphate/fructose-6-phosphate phosphoketolase
VLACCGEILTLETVAAAAILRDKLPNLKVRVVHVVDFMRLEPAKAHSHGLPDAELDALFTDEQPVIFAYHGYPTLIHRLTCRRLNHANIHVRGYKEEGTTTTPFDTVMPNGVDRFHHVIDVIDRVPRLSDKAGRLRREMAERRLEAPIHTRENRDDPNEIRDWTWPASASTCASL